MLEPVAVRDRPTSVSVVVPSRDAAATIVEQLEALGAQTYGGVWEVVVVDNRSTDGTAARVDEWAATHPAGSRCRVVPAGVASGPGHARNVGASVTDAPLLVFCDADDRVGPGWLAEMVEAARRADAVCGASSWDALNPAWLVAGRVPRGSRGRDVSAPPPLFGIVTDGNNLAVWRDAFESIGGFDETYLGGSEDKDFGYRLRLAGWRIAEAPAAVVEIRLRRRWVDRVRQSYARGREDVRLWVRFGPLGYPPSGLGTGVRTVGALILDLAGCHRPAQRVWWWNRASRFAGRVRGSIRHRTVFL